MYQIALCDDETAELNRTEKLLETYKKERPGCTFMTESFESVEELLYRIAEKNYMPNLLLLDIYMPGKMGIEAAKELRELGSEIRIVFLTTSRDYALDAYRVNASQYLVKPVAEEELFPVLDGILKDLEKEQEKYLILRIGGRSRKIALKDIIYCEAQKKSQYLQLADGSQALLHMTMAEIWEMLSGHREFVKVGVSYVVNLQHVDSLNAQFIEMDNGKTVFLPRGSYRQVKERYLQYYCEEDG